ncbi:uncharacterized protein [Periplaneta americana]|uniref:uncharacterized protein n=1 Tax=Periplaneta americana TaxID=6978 RepID=UPI0037E932E2
MQCKMQAIVLLAALVLLAATPARFAPPDNNKGESKREEEEPVIGTRRQRFVHDSAGTQLGPLPANGDQVMVDGSLQLQGGRRESPSLIQTVHALTQAVLRLFGPRKERAVAAEALQLAEDAVALLALNVHPDLVNKMVDVLAPRAGKIAEKAKFLAEKYKE